MLKFGRALRSPNREAWKMHQNGRAPSSTRPISSTGFLMGILMLAIVFVSISTTFVYTNHLSQSVPIGSETLGSFVHKNINDKPRSNDHPSLRFDWTNLSPSLELTKSILKHQSNCSIPVSTFTYRNRFGLGSDLHIYSQALGYGIHTSKRIRTVGNWTWMDQSECQIVDSNNIQSTKSLGSPMLCYFSSELNCPGDLEYALANPAFDAEEAGPLSKPNGNLITPTNEYDPALLPPRTKEGVQVLQTAVVGSLFTRVTPLVVQEAKRQLKLVFGNKVPKDLITVHIRWGDKVESFKRNNNKIRKPEMKKVEITSYIDAVQTILDKRRTIQNRSTKPLEEKANIYLATEDPEAVTEFRKHIPKHWKLFVDQFLIETTEHRNNEYNGNPKMAKELKGKAGLPALGSLLVAMEANHFVLTTKSNWSQLMDELRRAILDPNCGNCTSLIDLRPA